MYYAELYQDSVGRLSRAGIEDAASDVTLLVEWCFGLTRSRLFLQGDQVVDKRGLVRFNDALERRAGREPLHYIIGVREFWSLDFIVSPSVLVPRPETEFLLEHVIATLGREGLRGGSVLDMCTGSGVIAIILALELEAGTVVAVDRSLDALQVSHRNILKHGVGKAVSLVCSDLFTAFGNSASFELIVANPPYVTDDELTGLEPEVREWEPRSALTAGRDGLDIIRLFADRVPSFLQPGGRLFIEIGAAQKDAVYHLFAEQGARFYDCVDVVSDWSGRPRVLQARRRCKSSPVRLFRTVRPPGIPGV